MSEALIRELAERIAREQFLSQWPIYLLMLAFAFVGGALASYFGSYFKKRGEALATKSDFNDLLIQIKATTAATEEVKYKISHIDWTKKERTILLRTKLEELLLKLHELADWQDSQRMSCLYSTAINFSGSPLPKVMLLVVLYFPDLKIEIVSYLNSHRKIMILLATWHLKIVSPSNTPETQNIIQANASGEYMEQYRGQLISLASIEDNCYKIMSQLVSSQINT